MPRAIIRPVVAFGLVMAPTGILAFLPSTGWISRDQARLATVAAAIWFIVSLMVVVVLWRRDRRQEQRRARGEAAAANERAERMRRSQLLAALRNEYVLSHDGISPAMLAGLEPLPKEWTERRLAALGEPWRLDEYR
jgi:membrane protein implicated in regulation of membrane protease activity